MARPTLAHVVHTLRASNRRTADVPDSDHDLLARFVRSRDEAAFRALVNRHAKLVLSACRQVLTDPADLDDAFQATFVVLLKRAKAVDAATPLGGWLFAVAHRMAVRCRADNTRRRTREAEAARRQRTTAEPPDLSWREAAAVLHDELNALPDKYRLPLLLCCVHGLSRDEAAAELGTTLGAVRWQLERGRALLERRLTRRGLVLSAGLLAVLVGGSRAAGGPSAELIDLAVRAAGGHASSAAAALARGVFPMTTLKQMVLPVVLVLGLVGVGLGVGFRPPVANADEKPAQKPEKPKADAKAESKKAEPAERTITGTVVDADGKPVTAELMMVWGADKTQPLGKTAPDGTFRVTVPVQRKEFGGWVVATAAGHGLAFHQSGMGPHSMTPTAEVTLKLPKERTIRGKLLDQQGKPVAGGTVVATIISSNATYAATLTHLKSWATDVSRGFPHVHDRVLYFSDKYDARSNPGGLSPFVATSDKDGRYEIAGVGVGHIVTLRVRGPGMADKEFVTLNHEEFDPAPVNKTVKDTHTAMQMSGGVTWLLYGPDSTVVLEPEKIIRGKVTDHEGKPRAGALVTFTRTSKGNLNPDFNQVVTDKDGKYEIRGARKHDGYMVEVRSDSAAGLLPCTGSADDTVGYEPITIDLKCAKGVVVTGTVKNKRTGEPVPAQISATVLRGNRFVTDYPPFLDGRSRTDDFSTDDAGRFRLVTIPGPVILMARPSKEDEGHYKPATPDLTYPDRFTKEFGAVTFYTYGDGYIPFQGNWCRVLEAKPTDSELKLDVELEPVAKTVVKVMDTDGKPLAGTKAAGLTASDFFYPTECPTDTLTVYNLEPKKERLLAVVHAERKLVGTLKLTADTKDPVVTLGPGGTVTGRAVDKDDKPLAGLWVHLRYGNGDTTGTISGLNETLLETDANGEFRIDGLFPGREFRLVFSRNSQRFGPNWDKMQKYSIAKPGDTLKLGDLKLEPPAKTDEK